ncbi:hypothetical protein Daus18300_008440 [Diaporthe australafricana]|uniref:Uncharacterized protein n=1 Tax=Diaporthe australafricana TaxID=127596 RepID=A0ABR3WI49_9PEZI
MASKGPKIYRLDLGRIVVDGNRQPIIHVATLTLKDEGQDNHSMQVHVDGYTLAQWDLGSHGDRDSTGGEQFFSLNDQKMLQLTLPLLEDGKDSPRESLLKTVQVFLLKHEHFHTAVNYLSKDVGMRHVPLEHRLPKPLDVPAPEQTFAWHQPQGLPGSSLMGPPVRNPGRASSQGLQGRHRQSPALPVQRPYSVNSNRNNVPIDPNYRFQPNLRRGPRASFPQNGLSRRHHLPNKSPVVEAIGTMAQQYQFPIRRASMAGNAPSGFPLHHNGREPVTSVHQDRRDTDYVHDDFHHHIAHKESAYLARHIPSSASKTYLYQPSPSSSMPRETPAPRPRPRSAVGRLVRVQVLDPYVEHNHPHSQRRTRWEFALTLLPSTKVWELCVHAASYLNQHFEAGMDGTNLSAQGADGIAFGDQETVSEMVNPEETVFLAERNPPVMVQPNHAGFHMSSSDPLQPDWASPTPNPDVSDPASSRNKRRKLHLDAIDEDDQVPPPRELPFSSFTPTPLLRPSNRCDDIWLPFSQSAEVFTWAALLYEEKLQAAAEILESTDPSQKDYKEKVYQAAVHGYDFQVQLREKCSEVLRRSS